MTSRLFERIKWLIGILFYLYVRNSKVTSKSNGAKVISMYMAGFSLKFDKSQFCSISNVGLWSSLPIATQVFNFAMGILDRRKWLKTKETIKIINTFNYKIRQNCVQYFCWCRSSVFSDPFLNCSLFDVETSWIVLDAFGIIGTLTKIHYLIFFTSHSLPWLWNFTSTFYHFYYYNILCRWRYFVFSEPVNSVPENSNNNNLLLLLF